MRPKKKKQTKQTNNARQRKMHEAKNTRNGTWQRAKRAKEEQRERLCDGNLFSIRSESELREEKKERKKNELLHRDNVPTRRRNGRLYLNFIPLFDWIEFILSHNQNQLDVCVCAMPHKHISAASSSSCFHGRAWPFAA